MVYNDGSSEKPQKPHKPPLGAMPRKLHEELRMRDLSSAISRFIIDNQPINIEWVEEYNELVVKLGELK